MHVAPQTIRQRMSRIADSRVSKIGIRIVIFMDIRQSIRVKKTRRGMSSSRVEVFEEVRWKVIVGVEFPISLIFYVTHYIVHLLGRLCNRRAVSNLQIIITGTK